MNLWPARSCLTKSPNLWSRAGPSAALCGARARPQGSAPAQRITYAPTQCELSEDRPFGRLERPAQQTGARLQRPLACWWLVALPMLGVTRLPRMRSLSSRWRGGQRRRRRNLGIHRTTSDPGVLPPIQTPLLSAAGWRRTPGQDHHGPLARLAAHVDR